MSRHPEVDTSVITGQVEGTWSVYCTLCGDCGGNYPTKAHALNIAYAHASMPHPGKVV